MEPYAEMTQGDSFYDEIAFVDQYGAPKDMTGWTVEATFRPSFNSITVLADLTADNDGIGFINADTTTGMMFLTFDASVTADLDIPTIPRNGEMVPSKIIVGDVKLIPPAGVELVQGSGARTTIFLKVKAGLT